METSNPVPKGHPASLDFLKEFYPFHYIVGEAMEGALRGDTLTHHETVILWMIHSEGQNGELLPRKEVERLISSWYELGSPAITKVLKRMAIREEPLITIRDSARSGREKVIQLTPNGKEEIVRMMGRANQTIESIIAGWSENEIKSGLHFLRQVIERVEELKR